MKGEGTMLKGSVLQGLVRAVAISILLPVTIEARLGTEVTGKQSSERIVRQTKSVSFRTNYAISFKAVNVGTTDEALELLLPDSTKIVAKKYPSVKAKRVDRFGRESALRPEEEEQLLAMISAINYDTGWFPVGSPMQLRLIFQLSGGNVDAQLPGRLIASWDAEKVRRGASLPVRLQLEADPDGGNVSFQGGLIFNLKLRINLPQFGLKQEIDVPYVPQINLGWNERNTFTSFLLKKATGLYADFGGTTIASVGLKNIPAVALLPIPIDGGIGLKGSGFVRAVLRGDRVSNRHRGIRYDILEESEGTVLQIPIPEDAQIERRDFAINPVEYVESFTTDLGIVFTPEVFVRVGFGTGVDSLKIPLNLFEYRLPVADIHLPILNKILLDLPFNQEAATFSMSVLPPSEAPLIASISPQSGKEGDDVVITGRNFGTAGEASSVTFAGNIEATYASWNDTSIRCRVPPGVSSGLVIVSTTSGTSNGVAFSVVQRPVRIVSGPSVSDIERDSATITWITDQSSTGIVDFGATSSYGARIIDSVMTTRHSVLLTQLTSSTTYHFRIQLVDENNKFGSSSAGTFVTGPDPIPPQPVYAGLGWMGPGKGPAPVEVEFINNSSGPITGWQWDFGDGNTSKDRQPKHTYQQPGKYAVTLTVVGADGLSSTMSMGTRIEVYDTLKVDFTWSPAQGVAWSPVTFTDSSKGTIEARHWDFGDSSFDSADAQENPSHIYKQSGTYKVVLTAYPPSGASAMKEKEIIVRTGEPDGDFPAWTPWPMFGHDPRHTGRSPHKGPYTGSFKWKYTTGGITSSPVIGADGTIYVGARDGELHAINPNGTLKWTLQTEGRIGMSSPAIGRDGVIYIGGNNEKATTDDAKVYAVNPDGTLRCATSSLNAGRGVSPVIAGDETIYIGVWARLWGIGPGCQLKWPQPYFGGESESSPAIGPDGTVYIGRKDGFVAGIDSTNGKEKWIGDGVRTYIVSSAAVDSSGTIYIGTDGGAGGVNRLYAFHPPDHTARWSYATGGPIRSSPAIAKDGVIYVGCNDGILYAVYRDGTPKWSYKTGAAIGQSSPVIDGDGVIYIGSRDGKLYAINPDGTLKWSYETGASIESSPVIGADSTIYVGSTDGNIYAVGDSLIDTTPPAPIGDLAVMATDGDWVQLAWTAPGDDSIQGQASSYDLRYATSLINTERDWDRAKQVYKIGYSRPIGLSPPSPAGSKETFMVSALASPGTYYFAIKTADEVPNWSRLSRNVGNVERVTTGKPFLVCTPDSMVFSANSTSYLLLSNRGTGVLNWHKVANPRWIDIVPTSGSIPENRVQRLKVTLRRDLLRDRARENRGPIGISYNGGANSPKTMQVIVKGKRSAKLVVEEEGGEQPPDKLQLFQNVANPFNPETVIRYTLPALQRVSLAVYSLAGQQVKILADEAQEAGWHSVAWNGTDQYGRKVASGIYFYRLQAGSLVETKKMLLLR